MRLLGKVITVSVETVKLVSALAQRVTVEDWMVSGPIRADDTSV